FKLGLPPWLACRRAREGVAVIATLCVVLAAVVAWQLGRLATIAPALFSGTLLAGLTPTVLVIRRRYRHVVAGVLVLAMLLGLLAAAVHRYGYAAPVALVVGTTPSAHADAVSRS